MTAIARQSAISLPAVPEPRPLRLLVIARLVCGGGATRAELVKDLAPLAGHRLSPAELRRSIDIEIATLVADVHATELRYRISLLPTGVGEAHAALGSKVATKSQTLTWTEVRDLWLVAVALGLAGESAPRIKGLLRADGLQAAILRKAYGLPFRECVTPARLRTALAVVALERAFGNKIKNGLGTGAGLSAKAGRLLASQLSTKPRDFGTDRRLVAALAAEHLGCQQTDIDALRLAVLRGGVAKPSPPPSPAPVQSSRPSAIAASPPQSAPSAPVARPAAASRPDLRGFAHEIQVAARSCADGWPGNRKSYISDVWQVLRERRPEWGLTEIEFKGMLAEAHRTGFVVLANADLKDRQTLGRVQKSAIAFKNTVLHFVRVEE